MELFPSRPVALSIGPVDIHWYGIMYLLGFLLGMWLLPRLQRYRGLSLSAEQRDKLVFNVFLGVLLGGRLGYVLFYGGSEYFAYPLKILAVWEGGMSSHGGFIGVTIALLIFAWRERVKLLPLADVLVVPVALGLALGRMGNLINGELYGTITLLPWGMHFLGVEGLRHPTQIYAALKDILIALVCFLHLKHTAGSQRSHGMTAALFLIFYALLRFLVEYVRDQSFVSTYVIGGVRLSEGQLLTLPVF
ncbi:MAG: prolipoprotein diacylglyceryl transferase, partial [Candidatus Peribacteraceae bacterium]